MVMKRFLLPWQKKYTITCPKCGGKIETWPLWFWQKQTDKLGELQFCHTLDSEFLEKIPVLTENDWKSKQKSDAFWKELTDDSGNKKPYKEIEYLFTITGDGLPKIVPKHGIFALINLFTKTELKALFLLLGLEPSMFVKQAYFRKTMEISTAYVSTILKKFRSWRLIQAGKVSVKGRAHGRQLAYSLTDEARKILDQDLQNYNFFREAVIETVTPIAERFSTLAWRKDLVKLME